MQFSDPIILIAEVYPDKPDENGDQKPVDVERGITFGNEKGVFQNEFFAAEQAGVRAEAMIEVWSEEYDGERAVIINGKRLEIYRTHKKGEKTELYCGTKVGKSHGSV